MIFSCSTIFNDCNLFPHSKRNTPLHFAAANNHPHSTNELLNFADVMLTNEDSKTAYHVAIENKAFLSQTVIENFIMNSVKN